MAPVLQEQQHRNRLYQNLELGESNPLKTVLDYVLVEGRDEWGENFCHGVETTLENGEDVHIHLYHQNNRLFDSPPKPLEPETTIMFNIQPGDGTRHIYRAKLTGNIVEHREEPVHGSELLYHVDIREDDTTPSEVQDAQESYEEVLETIATDLDPV